MMDAMNETDTMNRTSATSAPAPLPSLISIVWIAWFSVRRWPAAAG